MGAKRGRGRNEDGGVRAELILGYLPHRIKQLGFSQYNIRYRDFLVAAETTKELSAYNELYFIVDSPQDLKVESDYGIYDTTGEYVSENTHQHRGAVKITNPTDTARKIEFIQVIIIK